MADKFHRELYFPTAIYVTDLENAESLNAELIKAIRAEKAQDEAGIHRSNVKALGGWHSQNDLMRKAPYAEITKRIRAAAERVARDCGYDSARKMRIGSMWSIINPKGSFNVSHIHPDCLWSGVYYVQAPKGSGRISFTEPRTQNMMRLAKHEPNTKRPKHCWTQVKYEPRAGKMIIFPAWLYHSVEPNLAEEEGDAADRIIISFNINQS